MRFVFEPALGELKNGEIIEFNVRNDGQIQHEFSIGSADDQVKHALMIQKMPDLIHNDANTVSLAPGDSAILTWKFMGKDTAVLACNIPGHFEAGMEKVVAICE
jgi:uncharacterized cupredoxin-like copper-binding protein